MAYLGKTPSQAVRQRYFFTATGGETSISGADDNGTTLNFVDGAYADVYLNGVLLVYATDYNTNTANTIAGLGALVASDIVEIIVYDTFAVFGGQVQGDLTVTNGTLTATTVAVTGNLDVDGTIEFDALSGTGSVSVTDILDEDNMASDSATALATQQSIKAYADTKLPLSGGAMTGAITTNSTFDGVDIATRDAVLTTTTSTANSALQNVVEDTTPQLGGDLASNGNDVLFGDNDKAIFGAGSDLQIYHSGTSSRIQDLGTGNLIIDTNGTEIQLTSGSISEYMLRAVKDGAVTLYYDSAAKLATTATGVDVTGTVTADGLIASTGSYAAVGAGSGRMYGSSSHGLVIQGNGTTNDLLFLGSDGSDSFRIAHNKDISFYEDTGTTAKFHWDAADERLGIGTTSPSSKLHLGGTAPMDSIIRQDSTASGTNWEIGERVAGKWQIWEDDGDSVVATFQSNGNVGIGTDSPPNPLSVRKTNSAYEDVISIIGQNSPTDIMGALAYDQSTDLMIIRNDQTYATGGIAFRAGGTSNHLFIKTGGNVGIGTDNPAEKLEVDGSIRVGNLKIQPASAGRIGFNRNTANGAIYDSGYSAVQINGPATSNPNYMAFETYNSSGGNGTTALVIEEGGNIGIGTTTPQTKLHVDQRADNNGITLANSVRGVERVEWELSGVTNASSVFQQNNGTNRQRMLSMSRAEVVLNDEGADQDFRVESDNNASMLTVDAGADLVTISGGSKVTNEVLRVNGAQVVGSADAGVYTLGISNVFAASAAKYLRIQQDGNLFGGLTITATGNYSNVNAIGCFQKIYSIGANSSNTSLFGTGNVTVADLGATSGQFSMGTPTKPNGTTIYIPLTNLNSSYIIHMSITVEFRGRIGGISAIDIIDQ